MSTAVPFPPRFPPADWVEALLNYLERFKPDLRTALIPASADQIAALEQCAGVTLPAPYRAWLEKVGQDDGTLFPSLSARLGVENATEVYRDTPASERADGAFYIGYGRNGDYPDLSLATDREGTLPVVVSDARQILFTLADSLPHLLFQQAFLSHELPTFPVRRYYGISREQKVMDRVRDSVVAAGLAPRNFSDSQTLCAGHSDVGVALHQIVGGSGWLVIGAPEETTCLALAEQIAEPHDLSFIRQEATGQA